MIWAAVLVAAAVAYFLYEKYLKQPPSDKWVISENGNYTTLINGRRLTVFESDGGYKFCCAIGDEDDPYFSDVYDEFSSAQHEALAFIGLRQSVFQSINERRNSQRDARSASIWFGYISSAAQQAALEATETKSAIADTTSSITSLRTREKVHASALKKAERAIDYFSSVQAANEKQIASSSAEMHRAVLLIVQMEITARKSIKGSRSDT